MRDAKYRAASTGTIESSEPCRTRVGTRTAGRTWRMSISLFIRFSASIAPGLAP